MIEVEDSKIRKIAENFISRLNDKESFDSYFRNLNNVNLLILEGHMDMEGIGISDFRKDSFEHFLNNYVIIVNKILIEVNRQMLFKFN